jgi:hypothetical protein
VASHQVRRLPVVGGHRPAGIAAVADAVRALPDRAVGDLLEVIFGDRTAGGTGAGPSQRLRPLPVGLLPACAVPRGSWRDMLQQGGNR